MPRLRRSTGGTRTLAIGLAVLALVALLPSLNSGLRWIARLTVATGGGADPRPDADFWSCVERRLDLAVPPGANVWVANSDVTTLQRLSEISLPKHRVVGGRAPGVYLIGLQRATGSTAPNDCNGVRLTVARVP